MTAELDASAAPYLFPESEGGVGGGGGYPPAYTGGTLLGALLRMYRDNNSLVCELKTEELFVLIEFAVFGKLQASVDICTGSKTLALDLPLIRL